MKVILVTGGCGFIASNFIHKLLDTNQYFVVNIDKLNYCANTKNVTQKYDFNTHEIRDTDLTNYVFYKTDINNADFVLDILCKHKVNIVYHFAAQTHIDQSFGNSKQFVYDNILGTTTLLECCLEYGQLEKFIHVSTDEVYGEISPDNDKCVLQNGFYDPTNPYAATKAAAELIVKSFHRSYKLPVIITRSNNIYGPAQFWEKVFPKFIYNLYHDRKCPIYGAGQALRKFLYVGDACDAYLMIMQQGQIGHIYEMGSSNEFNTLQVLKSLISKIKPDDVHQYEKWINFVEDRKFHDQRYLVNSESLSNLGWKEQTLFEDGLSKTIEWYTNYAIPHNYWNYETFTMNRGTNYI